MAGYRLRALVVPGRFQPPHLGHMSLIRQALEAAERVYIVVGSAQDSYTLENPLTAGERIEALEAMLEEELGGEWPLRLRIYPVPDIEMNKVWVQYLRMLLPRFDGVMSGNELVLMLFEDMGFKALRPRMYRRSECSGTEIRRRAVEGGDWESCLSPSVVRYLREIGFRERLARLAGAVG